MKLTKNNKQKLIEMGFKPDVETKGNFPQWDGWWSLENGWTFNIDGIDDSEQLKKQIKKINHTDICSV